MWKKKNNKLMKKNRILPRLDDVTEVLTKNPKLLLNEKNNYTAEKLIKNISIMSSDKQKN